MRDDHADRLARLQETLHHEIPLTRAIGLVVDSYIDGCLVLKAPLGPNINHKDTAFAGSLNAVVTLVGWSLLWLVLDTAGLYGKIVIQDSTINYRRPVTTDFAARCCLPDQRTLAPFLAMLRRKGRARLELTAEIREEAGAAVSFVGRYVVHLTPAFMDSHTG